MAKNTLWLLTANMDRPDIHLAIPTIAWMAKRKGITFECYLECKRDGRLFARTGSTVLGGRHHQQFNYLHAAFDVEHILLGETFVFRSSIEVFQGKILAESDSLVELYQTLLPEIGGTCVPEVLFAPDQVLTNENAQLDIGPYLFPEIFYREAIAFPPSLAAQVSSLLGEITANAAVRHIFLSSIDQQQVQKVYPDACEVDLLQEGDDYGTVTLRIADRWKHQAKGLAFGDPAAILSQLPSLCRDSRIAVYAPKVTIQPSEIVVSRYAEETSAISSDVIRLANEIGNRVLVGRQTGDGDLFTWAKGGVCLQIMDPNRPPFPSVNAVMHPWHQTPTSLYDLEPDDNTLRQYAQEGRILATVIWHSGEMAHNEAMLNLFELACFTGLKMGIGVHAQRYETCPQLWELLNIPTEVGGVLGLIEPLLHSGGMGVMAEVNSPPHLLRQHCDNALTSIRSLAGDGSTPRGYYAFMDTDLATLSEKNDLIYQEIAASGLEYAISSITPGRNRIMWQTENHIVLNQTCRVIHGASPFVRITTLEDIETASQIRPGWLIGTLDAPVIAFSPYIWEAGSRLMKLVRWFTNGSVINALPHTIARYARIIGSEGFLRNSTQN